MVVPLCVPVVALLALSVMTAVKTISSRLVKLPLSASKVAALKLSVLSAFNSPIKMV